MQTDRSPEQVPRGVARVDRALRLLAAILWMGPLTASAAFIATDGFDAYLPGDLAGQGAAAIGWAGAWAPGAGAAAVNSDIVNTAASGALNFTPAGGTQISGGRCALDIYPPAGVGGAGKTGITTTRPLFTPQTGTFYVAYAIKWQSGNFNTGDTVAIHLTDSATDVDRGFNFGYRGLPGTYGVMCRKGTASPVAGAFATFSGNSTVRYLVAKFEKVASANYNKITVWVNPGVTSETTLPNGDCQLTGVDSGVSAVSSVNVRVENLKGPDATSNGDDRVRVDSLALATAFRDVTVDVNPGPRPFVWVRDAEKASILAKISGNAWATSVFNAMVARAASGVASHQAARDAFLRELPVRWTQSPPVFHAIPTTATESQVRGPLESKLNLGVDCAVLYYLTGDAKYARCAADILHNSVKSLIPLAPSTSTGNGGWIFRDDFLKEARVTGTQMPIIYDFLHGYLNAGNQVYDVATAGMVNFSFPNSQTVFRTFYDLARDHGQTGSNWSSLMAPCMVNNILALDDATERSAALQIYLVTGSARQQSLQTDAAAFAQPGDIWPESLQYASVVVANDTYLMVLLERVDPNLNLFELYPNLPLSVSRPSYLKYPNGEQITYGDGPRDGGSQPFFSYETVYDHARDRGRSNLTALYGALINGGVAAAEYNRSTLAGYSSLGRHDEPNQLLWFAPTIPEVAAPLALPRTDTLPFAGIALQRNPSSINNSANGLMGFVGGAGFVHSHASGMGMELYGLGQVLGGKSGHTTYGDADNENYYRVFASNNTVIVNGASRGLGDWSDIAINTVQTVAMEPAPFAGPVSPDVSFTCSSFVDDKGTLAQGTQQRTLAIIRTSPTSGFYVDVFRSKSTVTNRTAVTLNGSVTDQYHDYIYRNVGHALDIESSGVALPLFSQASRFQNDIGDSRQQPGWRYFTNTVVSQPSSATVRAQFEATPTGQSSLYMDLHMPGATNREYAKVNSPAIVDAPPPYQSQLAPTLVMRQTGEAWNRPFTVVYEPHFGKTSGTVQNVTKLLRGGVLVGLKIESFAAGRNLIHYVLSNPNANETYTDAIIGLSFTGRFAVIADTGNATASLYLGEGSQLSYRGQAVSSVSGGNVQANVQFAAGTAPIATSAAALNITAVAAPSVAQIARLPDGRISMTATGAVGVACRVWTSTDLSLPGGGWTQLGSGTVTASPFVIQDTAASSYPARFYRFTTP